MTSPSGSRPLISIVIPAFNRATYIGELLDTVLRELALLDPGDRRAIEVVVSDNASTDATVSVVEEYRDRLPMLTLVRQTTNIGPDRNYLAVVAAAHGEFCWLMGSDDVLETGALVQAIALLRAHPSIVGMCVNRWARTFDLSRVIPEDVMGSFAAPTRLDGVEEVTRGIVGYLSYLSGTLVRRSAWDDVVAEGHTHAFFNAFVHVYVILEMVKRRPIWLVTPARLVGWRSDNDWFLANGRYRRLALDVVGYEQIAREVFGRGTPNYRTMTEAIARRHLWYSVLTAYAEGSWKGSTVWRTRKLTLRHYWWSGAFWRKTGLLIFAPKPLIVALMKGRRALRRHVTLPEL